MNPGMELWLQLIAVITVIFVLRILWAIGSVLVQKAELLDMQGHAVAREFDEEFRDVSKRKEG